MSETETPWTPGPWEVVSRLVGPLIIRADCPAGFDRIGKLDVALVGADTFALAAANAELIAAAPSLYEALEAYSRWEADLIMSNEAWSGGFAELPTITQELWDRFIEIQGMRNAALALARGEDK
jgi:hypothetical protein